MPAVPEKLAALRQLLAARFPADAPARRRSLATGVPAIDDATGGLPTGALTEIVCAAPSCGGLLFLARLLEVTRTQRNRAAFIDTVDSFDPQSHLADLLRHLVWVRCRQTAEALHAVDLVARDANLALVILDLRRSPAAELRRIPATAWYRLQRAAEQSDVALVVETPRATVASARLRLVLEQSHPLAALEQPREFLAMALPATLQRSRRQPLAQEAV